MATNTKSKNPGEETRSSADRTPKKPTFKPWRKYDGSRGRSIIVQSPFRKPEEMGQRFLVKKGDRVFDPEDKMGTTKCFKECDAPPDNLPKDIKPGFVWDSPPPPKTEAKEKE